jgi:hypothetical protein
MLCEGNVPSIQRKTSPNQFSSMGEVDGLGFSLIDYCVPALTPRLQRSEAALKLSENITSLAICSIEDRAISEEGWLNPWDLQMYRLYKVCTG